MGEHKELPQDFFKTVLIVNIYRKKGNRQDCDNYFGISLLEIVGKVLGKIMLKRLQIIANGILPELVWVPCRL